MPFLRYNLQFINLNVLLGLSKGLPGGSLVQNLPANVGDTGLIPGSGSPLEKEMATHFSIFA